MNVIFHSNISKVGNDYFGKEIFNEYLYGLSKTNKISFISDISIKREHFHTEKLNPDLINVIPLPKNLLYRLFFLIKEVRKTEKSLIFMPTYTALVTGMLSVILNKKYVIYHGTDWQNHNSILKTTEKIGVRYWSRLKRIVYLKLDNIVSSNANAILVTGGQIKEKYIRLNAKVIETKPIINLNFQGIYNRTESNVFNVLFVGNLNEKKGVYDLLKTIKTFKDKNNIKFTIVGDGIERQKMEKFSNVHGLEKIITFKGFVKNGPELFREYINADVLILPSYSEGFPRVFYEAMFFNTAIITTPVNSIPYLLKDKITALFIEPKNPFDIEKKIICLLQDPILLKELQNNGKSLVTSILTEPAWQQHTKVLRDI